MRQVARIVWLSFLLAGGCRLNQSGKNHCNLVSDCLPGYACVAGVCTAPGTGTSCAGPANCAPSDECVGGTCVARAPVASISIAPATFKLPKGSRAALIVSARASDGAPLDPSTLGLTWSSSDASVASVDDHGVVRALAAGTATIEAAAGAVTGKSLVTVTAAQLLSVQISPSGAHVPVGMTQQLSAEGAFDDGSAADVTERVTWDARTAIANGAPSNLIGIVASGAQAGLATAKSPGTVFVFASDGAVSAWVVMTVSAAVVTQVAVDGATAPVPAGRTTPLHLKATFSDNSTSDLTSDVTWSSSDSATASVDATGVVGGLKPGSATITGSWHGLSASKTVEVSSAVVTAIAVTPMQASVAKGLTQAFHATASFSDGSQSDVTAAVAWSAAGSGAANLTTGGVATGAQAGMVTVTARDVASGVSGSAMLQVTAAVPTSFEVRADRSGPQALYTQAHYSALVHFTDGTTKDVTLDCTWSSSNTSVGKIGGLGWLDAYANGTTTVTAQDVALAMSASATATVTGSPLTSLTINPTSFNVRQCEPAVTFQVTGHYADGSSKNLTQAAAPTQNGLELSWTYDPNIMQFNYTASDGATVTAGRVGTTTLTATDSWTGQAVSAPVTVAKWYLTTIFVTPQNRQINPNGTMQYTADGWNNCGNDVGDITDSVTWSSSGPQVSISNSAGTQGLATGVSDGTVTITATDPSSGVKGTSSLTVVN